MRHFSIGEAAACLGVAVSTLRRRETEGRLIPAFRTPGGHRRYAWVHIENSLSPGSADNKPVRIIGYARVSSHDQKADLARQRERLQAWGDGQSAASVEVIEDPGSGLNYKKKGLRRLLRMITTCSFSHLVLTHKDRLLRFGGLVFH